MTPEQQREWDAWHALCFELCAAGLDINDQPRLHGALLRWASDSAAFLESLPADDREYHERRAMRGYPDDLVMQNATAFRAKAWDGE